MQAGGSWLLVASFLALSAFASLALPQSTRPRSVSVRSPRSTQPLSHRGEDKTEITVKGCIHAGKWLAADSGTVYRLSGDLSAATMHDGEEVSIRGRKIIRRERPSEEPAIESPHVERVFPRPPAAWSFAVTDSKRWRQYTYKAYGVRVALPGTFPPLKSWDAYGGPGFLVNRGTVEVAAFGVPGNISNSKAFAAGPFVIFRNPNISSRSRCFQSDHALPWKFSWRRFGRSLYREGLYDAGGMGSGHYFYNFHTFHHGACYAFWFEVDQANLENFDDGCRIPSVSREQQDGLIGRILSRIRFFAPQPISRGE